jgi:predicted phosphodiesterase
LIEVAAPTIDLLDTTAPVGPGGGGMSDRIAVISDIHGNSVALKAVLEEISREGITRTVCLGDVVGYGPEPCTCLQMVADHCEFTVRGNHEEAILKPSQKSNFNANARHAIEWTSKQLGSSELRIIANMPNWFHLSRDVVCVHDSPVPIEDPGYIRSSRDAAPVLTAMSERLCLFGHTHVPTAFQMPAERRFIKSGTLRVANDQPTSLTLDSKFLLNPGSVGQPRDGDVRASWAVLDLDQQKFTLRRTEYAISMVREAIVSAGLPSVLGKRLAVGA